MILKQQQKITSHLEYFQIFFQDFNIIINSFYIALNFILTTKIYQLVAKVTRYNTVIEAYTARNQSC